MTAPKLHALVAVLLIFAIGWAKADLSSYEFGGTVTEERFKGLLEELRCLVCQNESLIASQAELAGDLRSEVYALMAEGKSDTEVIDFLTTRYGDFVLYNPPLRAATYPLWIGPFVLLVLAGWILYRSIRHRNREVSRNLSESDRRRVAELLDQEHRKQEPNP